MVLQNFKIDGQNIGITCGSLDIDLHNEYDFAGFNYNVLLRQLTVDWNLGKGDWVGEDLPVKLMLKFHEVNFLQIVKNESREFRKDDKCLDNIGFANLEMRDDYISFIEKQTAVDNDIILIFLNEQTIRVNAESVELIFEG